MRRQSSGSKGICKMEYATCRWPNGEEREVVVMERKDNGDCRIIWNETIDGGARGQEETVPSIWVSNTRPNQRKENGQ